jgi:Rps23 Pro-64 3,4-dihydroxylase Tpa1-like proline 4-hydroxylase
MRLRKSLRENKYIAAQMDQYDPLLEETLFAFQDPRIVAEVGDICGMQDLSGDENLYAGGISLMEQGQFLNPHLDNSHDKDRRRWRALNILYYVSPGWKTEHGGNLEIWPHGVKQPPVTITSRFNRLAVMATHGDSWHSVSPVRYSEPRCCVSNYYFSGLPLRQDESFHVTSFRGRPEQPLRDLFLRGDTALRMGIRRFFSRGLIETDHVYKKQVDVSQSED